MKAAVFASKGRLDIRDVPLPDIKPDEVLIRVKAVGICGTDIHVFNGEYFSEFPLIPGHEFSGIIEKAGSRVPNLREGDRVTADPNLYCESCYFCKMNLQNHCDNLKVIGVTTDGAFAEYVAVPYRNVFPIGQEITFEQAAFIEPLACVAHGMDMINIRFGSEVLIIGAGPIGLLLLQGIKGSGGARVTIMDVDTGKLKAAAGFGADDTVLADGQENHIIGRIAPRGFDAVIDATGIPSVIEKSIGYLKKGGKFLIFGVCPKDARISISPYDFFHCDWTVIGSFAIRKNFSQALNFILNHKDQLSSLVSLRGSIEEFPKLLEMKMSRKDLLKAQVQFSEET